MKLLAPSSAKPPLRLLLLLLALALFPHAARAQGRRPDPPAARQTAPKAAPQNAATSAPFVVLLGAKLVSIPAPPGFEEATSQFPEVKQRFTLTEAPQNDLLASHVTVADAAELRRGGQPRPDFYTKVSVLKALRAVDVSPANFAQLVAAFKTQGATMLKADSPFMRDRVKKLEQVVSDMNRGVTKVDIPETEMLGEIEDTPSVYSIMMLVRLQFEADGQTRTVPLLGSIAIVRVKQRVLYVYGYKQFNTSADADTLRKFTRDWTAQILAANPGR